MSIDPPFRDGQPIAWTFHRATCRWLHNVIEPPESRAPMASHEDLDAPLTRLPEPAPLDTGLGSLLRDRVSCRVYSSDPIPLRDLGTLLWAAYGSTGRAEFGPLEVTERPVPSGGGLYPLEVYVLARSVRDLAAGVYHYVPVHHGLERLRDEPLPRTFQTYLFMGQHWATDAAAVVVITGVPGRSLWKYGDRGYRYMLLEAGHAMQNLNLAAIGRGLGSCNLGGFFDDELAAVVRADIEGEFPLYAAAVGTPATPDRLEQRSIEQ